jgi:ATP-dependent DNA ligase
VRYPEFGFLGEIGVGGGVMLDGEIVVMKDGKPEFGLMLSREQVRNDLKIQSLSKFLPATYVVFDVLYVEGQSVMAEPLSARRELLRQFVQAVDNPRMVLSDGVVGTGKEYFEAATAQNLEGVMAKRLTSPYEAGRRTNDWLKIKQKHTLHCAIVGFVAEGDDIRSLVIAAQIGEESDAPLRCVGRVGSGLSVAMRRRLADLLFARHRDTPWIECEEEGLWVEPSLYCKVSYLEQTRAGHLRAPVFLDLIVDA